MNNEDRVPHWVSCPVCNEMTETKVFEDTVLLKFPLYCPKCKKETVINVVKLKMVRCE
ncbi:MAG: cysteine-rich KTR domain-containing protein [Candidatus Cryptobacteroides sp.]